MMAGNPNWWRMNSMHSPSQQPSTFSSPPPPSLFTPQYVTGSSAVLALNSLVDNQDFPQSWSQLLLGGPASEEDRFGGRSSHIQSNSSENWEDKILNPSLRVPVFDVKQEVAQSKQLYGHGDAEFQACSRSYNCSQQLMPSVSSPKPCVASLCSNILDFSNNNADGRNQHPNHSSECNSTATGVVSKKAKIQASSTQPPLKVRKEKLGDRITTLHQLVSPFGKTDTASVLFEVVEYIRFLQGQVEALSYPYLGINVSANKRHQHYANVEGERNCIFPEEPGQLLNDNCLKRRAASNQGIQDAPNDLRSRGLCLVPVSCTHAVGGDENGADYWAPAPGGGF